MEPELENLDILFRQTRPELVLENYFQKYNLKNGKIRSQIYANAYEIEMYKLYSGVSTPYLTRDEMHLRAEWMSDKLHYYNRNNRAMFGFLCDYAGQMLRIVGNEPVCRLDTIQEWNAVGLALDQDLLITAWLADIDTQIGRNICDKYSYVWPSVLHTDDDVINHLIGKGLAENHFHLKGSPQIFPITWVCIMNHPDRISKILKSFGGFGKKLRPDIVWDSSDNIMAWRERLLYAAEIRAALFKRMLPEASQNGLYHAELGKTLYYGQYQLPIYLKLWDVLDNVNSLRHTVGKKFRQLDNKECCLDYAISTSCYDVNIEHPFRVLSGERYLMYSCFAAQFRGELTEEYSDLLYLYILLKTSFRGEMIQSNYMRGFDNFALYQDRKDIFYEDMPEYESEGVRTAIRGQLEESNIKSLEARIMPAVSSDAMKRKVDLLDRQVSLSYEKENIHTRYNKDARDAIATITEKYYYVVHFPKSRYSADECGRSDLIMRPRNYVCRNLTKIKARAIKKFLQNSDKSYRVHGIDACANEIGCRPETFATEFRYLRGEENIQFKRLWNSGRKENGKIGVTYHVGEDFVDVVDGLRAVDEAIRFLGLRKGDRIGHGLVLGIDPATYYRDKKGGFSIYKQDYLDNLLWMIDKSLEFGISVEVGMFHYMQKKAEELFNEIYGESIYMFFYSRKQYGLGDYFNLYWDSWKLRGDHPDLYRSGRYSDIEIMYTESGYERYMKSDKKLDIYRNNPMIGNLLFLYHFDRGVKLRGYDVEHIKVGDMYIEFIEEIIRAFRSKISELGLAIECNLTSNVLIGSFRSYEKHPVFEFKPIEMDKKMGKKDMIVTLNTDDLGVFDTSLSNEYALIYSALQNKMRRNNDFGEIDIINYMNELRENGFLVSF